jgi:DNA-binding GntR family transcriptional regulator
VLKANDKAQNQIWLSRRTSYDLSSSTAPDYHDAILKVLEVSDGDKAQQAMRAHIRNVRERLVQSLDHKAPVAALQ